MAKGCEASSYLFRGPARKRRRLLGDWSPVWHDNFFSHSGGRGLSEGDVVVLLPVRDHIVNLIIRSAGVLVVESRDEIFSKGLSFGEIVSDSKTGARGSHSVVSFKVQRMTPGRISM